MTTCEQSTSTAVRPHHTQAIIWEVVQLQDNLGWASGAVPRTGLRSRGGQPATRCTWCSAQHRVSLLQAACLLTSHPLVLFLFCYVASLFIRTGSRAIPVPAC